ncbi:glycosyltransferase [Niveibacterium sp. SC-1]|uniref:glycosyltransferase n=1 Tax=Niveibacterium sp. SC-1 TaxID=3135646 RepID=UPI00311E6B7A
MPHRILLLTPTPTHPCDAGNRVRIHNLVCSLRELGHEVFMLHMEREPGDKAAMGAWLGEANFRSVPFRGARREESAIQRGLRHLQQLVDNDARHVWGLDDWYDPAVTEAALDWHRECGFTAVLVEYVFLSRLLEAFPGEVLKIIDTHDRFANRHRIYLERGLPPQFYSTTPRREGRGLDRADVVLAIQDSERAYFAGVTRADVLTLGHLLRLEDCLRAPDVAPRALIAGSSNPINVDGAQAFLDEVWPAVRQRMPAARLSIAGALSGALPDAPGVEKLGVVADMTEAYRAADLAINPVRQGTGLNIKSIEALGFGLPLATTPAGARGLEAAEGFGLRTCGTPVAMQEAIVELLGDAGLRREYGRRGMAFARDWNRRALGGLAHLLGSRA